MRCSFMIMVFTAVSVVILSGCSLKEKDYGKFTAEEVARMPLVQSESLPEPSDGVTLSILGETITADDVVNTEMVIEKLTPFAKTGLYELFAAKARDAVLEEIKERVSKKYIYHTAKRNAPSNIDEMLEKMVEGEVNRHLANYKNNYALAEAAFQTEKEFQDMGVTDWKSFREYKKMMIMVRRYLSKKIKKEKPVKLSDIKAVYNIYVKRKHPEFVWDYELQLRVIDIQPDKLKSDQIDSANGETREQAAVRIGKELLERIKKGENFGRLAKDYSHGIGNDKGGLWEIHIFGSLAEPYDRLDKAADKMNVGDVTKEVIEADGHVFIMKLEGKREGGIASFAEKQERIEREIKNMQQQVEYSKVLAEISDKIEVKDIGVFTDQCLSRAFELIEKRKAE